MATVVQGTAAALVTAGQTSFGRGFVSTPTSGNLLVLFYGARDDGDTETPTFTMPSGWTKVAETSPMEFHACGIAWRTSDGTETGTFTVTPGASVNSSWIGLVEFTESGVTSWQLDKFNANGSGAANAATIASGTTGTLTSAVGVAAIAGTSRTSSENLSTDTGTSLSSVNTAFEVDAGAANFIAAWLSLTATTALNATITQSGASRMGAAIATFVEAGGAGDVTLAGTAAGSSGATGLLTGVVPLAATAAGVSTGLGSLTVTGADVALAGSAAGSSTAGGVLTGEVPLVGTSAGGSTGQGVLTGEVPLAANTAGSSTAVADLTILGAVPLAGTSTGTSTATGGLTVNLTFNGTAAGTSTASSNLTVENLNVQLVGAAAGTSAATSLLLLIVGIVGDATGTSTAIGSLTLDSDPPPRRRLEASGLGHGWEGSSVSAGLEGSSI